MMTRGSNPIWFFNDLVGQPLNDEYYALFLTNTLPYIPQIVTHDPEGLIPWSGDTVQFGPNGGLPDNVYGDPSLVYRIEIRHGNQQTDALIYEINNYFFEESSGGGGGISNNLATAQNQITNPQFEAIDNPSPLVYTQPVAGTYTLDVAPGWFLDLTGAGTVTITQVPLSGVDAASPPTIPGNPPFYLEINTSGWTTAALRQRLQGNGAIFAGGAVSMSVTARAGGAPYNITLIDRPSGGTPPPPIGVFTVATTVFNVYSGAINLPVTPATANPDTGAAAFTDFIIQLQGTGIIDLTNIQVLGQNGPLPLPITPANIPPFTQSSLESQVNALFHVLAADLIAKPIPSYLVGWDFALNPRQFAGGGIQPPSLGANTSKYVWDQTIIFQSIASGVGVTTGDSGELVLTAAAATQLAVIQYLDGFKVREILNNPIAVNVSAKSSVDIKTTISLWYTADGSLPAMLSNVSLVGTLDANGKPATLNGTWVEVPRLNLPEAQFTIGSNATTNSNDYPFAGWDLQGIPGADTANYFAIVVGTGTIPINGVLTINSIGMYPGGIATRPAPQTIDEVLRECQYYFEKSWDPSTTPDTPTFAGSLIAQQIAFGTGGSTSLITNSFGFVFKTEKRPVVPLINFSSPSDGSPGNVFGQLLISPPAVLANGNIATSNWVQVGGGVSSVSFKSNNATLFLTTSGGPGAFAQAFINFHYTINARLGDV